MNLGVQNNGEPTRVAIYIRVSTSEQQVEGFGLEAQKQRLLDYVKSREPFGFTTKKEWLFSDTHTGSDLSRPALNELREGIRTGKFDAILVWKIDRLSRSLKHLLTVFEECEKHGVSFISVQEHLDFKGPVGKMIFQIFGAIAQFEREIIKGRTYMGRVASAGMGNYTGNAIPYGYIPVPNKNGKGKKLAIVPEEKKWVEQMFKWYIYEDLGFGQIAKRLNDLCVPKGKGSLGKNERKWTVDIVGNIIQKELYRGEFVANRKDENGVDLPEDEWTVVSIPPCVSEFMFQQAKLVCEDKMGGRVNRNYLLSGKLRDTTLDPVRSFIGCKRSKGGFSYRRKQFDKDGVRHQVFEVPAKPIEDYVWMKLMDALKEPDAFIQRYLSKAAADPKHIDLLHEQLGNLREQKVNDELSMGRIEEAYERGHYSEEKMAEKLAEKNASLGAIETKIQEIESELNLLSTREIEMTRLKEASEKVRYVFDDLDLHKKRTLISLFVDRVEMYRERQAGDKHWDITAQVVFRFNPERTHTLPPGGRTHSGLEQAENSDSELEKMENGHTARSRTHFSFSICESVPRQKPCKDFAYSSVPN